jgi:colanic acid biosynthesis glycosyl transferase WcaI
LVYSIHYAPEFTGVGRYSGEIAQEFARLGASVEVVAAPPHYPGWRVTSPWRNRYASERLNGVSVRRCPLYLARDVRGLTRLLAPLAFALSSLPLVIWRLVVDRPHVMLLVEPTLIPAPIAGAVARLGGTRSVLHVQDLEIDGAFEVGHLKGRLLRKAALLFERISLGLFDRVLTISETMRRRLIDKGVSDAHVAIIRNWVDLDKISCLPDPAAYRQTLGISRDDFVVQYSGNIGAKQALDLLCDAAAQLADRPDICFVVAGDGPDRARLQVRYHHLPNLRFLDFQPEEHLCAFMNMPDLHIIPQLPTSADFALPSKLGGILASGRPLLVTAGPEQELSRFLGDAATIIPPGNPERLAQSIAELADARSDGYRPQRIALANRLSAREALADFVAEIAAQACKSRNNRKQKNRS